ncbi:hypothetical protein BO86DRAFT_387646 [Aspergillus japonicus CBS 114.51]|uniref:Uncharacterized protein n=2 Tax=Aspergillus TaxID=5052 RepID=A0A2V5GZ15_ASPV1|nr:hypothetical protein BO86DRAFT_387646 [Aspergillus japonicus CBS 114.51]PYI13593.1 hypothetical protein BO99DRAFT_49374 [Aspergillus violaceofuscus CBS 115571]RAH83802.1 hypothetical protein BO86DRAFT_387646 [Aspergillus japonicus CBS 114.51]
MESLPRTKNSRTSAYKKNEGRGEKEGRAKVPGSVKNMERESNEACFPSLSRILFPSPFHNFWYTRTQLSCQYLILSSHNESVTFSSSHSRPYPLYPCTSPFFTLSSSLPTFAITDLINPKDVAITKQAKSRISVIVYRLILPLPGAVASITGEG